MIKIFTDSDNNRGPRRASAVSAAAATAAIISLLTLTSLGHEAKAQTTDSTSANAASLIANAESAGPPDIAKHAAILVMPTKVGELVTLRKGNNGWTCFPDLPATPANDPMCVDDVWLEWFMAGMKKRPAKIERVGLAYMLQGGEAFDQRDPALPSSPPGKKPYFVGPHVMVILPNPKELAGVSHDVYNGGPFVEALERDHPLILIPVASPGSKLKVIPDTVHP